MHIHYQTLASILMSEYAARLMLVDGEYGKTQLKIGPSVVAIAG